MRKIQQKQILELLKTVEEAQAAGLYADCQQGALTIGEFIEDIEGEGTQTVALLEEYCEKLFQASNGEIGEKALSKQLLKVENSVKNELKPNRIEMAFISYKASMSDSIESIYLAAKEDPACDAYWIPVPYYDKTPDGTLKEMQFEGPECYDKGIECTNWQEYDLEARRPDAIFTFNPHDAENHITTIHPNYYTERMKNFTDCLVYVPYYAVSSTKFTKAYAPWCYTPGCLDAHKIFVQSEKLRDFYINEFTKMVGTEEFGDPKKKFIALGSPKFDKVINSKREDFELPEEWESVIAKRLATRDDAQSPGVQSQKLPLKKVILYNTSIGAIVLSKEQYIKKLRYALDMFKNCEDIVLWWRPHPLSLSTFESMRSTLADDYKAIVEQYRSEGWGIYDDTPDLHRAIACTDAYFGDGGSLPSLYGMTGKPVVMQDVTKTDRKIPLSVLYFSVDNEDGCWAFDAFRDGLFKLNFSDNTGEYVAKSDSTPVRSDLKYPYLRFRYVHIKCIGDEIFCFPANIGDAFVYNRNNKMIKKVPLDCDYLLSTQSNGFLFVSVVPYRENIYCFGRRSKAVVVVNTVDHCVKYDEQLYKHIGLTTKSEETTKYPIYTSECDDGGTVTFLLRDCEHLVRYTLPTQKVEYIASNPILAQCVRACFDGQYYWLITENSDAVIKWDKDNDNVVKYPLPIDGASTIVNREYVYSGIINCDDYLLLFPLNGCAIYKLDKETGTFDELESLPVPEDKYNRIKKYRGPRRIGDKVYVFAEFSNTMYELDIPSGSVTERIFYINETDNGRYIGDYLQYILSEDDTDDFTAKISEKTLGDALSFLANDYGFDDAISAKQRNRAYDFSTNTTGTAGKEIYEYIKSFS